MSSIQCCLSFKYDAIHLSVYSDTLYVDNLNNRALELTLSNAFFRSMITASTTPLPTWVIADKLEKSLFS